MRGLGDSDDDMERFALDPDTADRLLSGTLEPEDAPHRYGEVACLLQIAARPTPGALDGEAAAVAQVVEAIRSSPSPACDRAVGARPRRTRLKAIVGVAVAAVTLTSGLAAADALPAPAQQVAADALEVVGVHVPSPTRSPGPLPRKLNATHPAPTTVSAPTTTLSTTAKRSPSTTTPHADSTAVSPTSSVVSQPGARAGRTQTTTAPPADAQSGAPQSAPAATTGGSEPSAAPGPTSSPTSGSPQKQAAQPAPRRTGGTNGSAGSSGSDGADGAPGATQAAPERTSTTPTTSPSGS